MDINSFALGYSAGKKKGGGSGGGGGVELNIAYGDTPPTDTSKLWVKSDKATAVKIAGDTITGDSLRPASVENFGAIDISCYDPITALVGKKVYIFGGRKANGTEYNTIKVFDIDTRTTTTLAETLPTTLSSAGCGVVGTNIFMFGGVANGSTSTSLYMFDTLLEKVTDFSDLYKDHIGSIGLKDIACVTVGDIIYLFGGVKDSGQGTSAIYRFNGAKMLFMGSGVSVEYGINQGFACAHVKDVDGKDVIYVFACGSYGGKYYIWKYKCDGQVVTRISEQATETLYWSPAVTIDNQIYILAAGSGNKAIFRFDPANEKFEKMDVVLRDNADSAVLFEHGALIFGGQNTYVQNFLAPIDTMPLENGHLKIVPAIGVNPCQLINSDSMKLAIGVKEVYKGDENNEGQPVEAAVYQYGAWQTI